MQSGKTAQKPQATQRVKQQAEGERKIIRISDTDIDGSTEIKNALRIITGISFSYANAIIKVLGINGNTKLQDISAGDMDKLKDIMKNPHKNGIPGWMYNWRKDENTGLDTHLIGNDLKSKHNLHIQEIKTSRSYRGYRHSFNYKMRGQRVKSRGANFKGRIGNTIGVTKKTIVQQPAAKQ
ncbi:MAG: 30S ribosomal protein S13 [Candidatus Parvarchaeota archaeon]|nr:30S ribosomal protein S13 [Candidatus Parvarchaeota archaeon]